MKCILKRIISSVLAFVLCLNTCTLNTYAQEIKIESGVIEKNKYEIMETINSEWTDGYVETIRIKNNSDEVFHDWSLYFEMNNKITSIWNSKIFYCDEIGYSLECYEWNRDIRPGEYVEIGFVATGRSKEICEFSLFVENPTVECDIDEEMGLFGSELNYNSNGSIEFTTEQITRLKEVAVEEGVMANYDSTIGKQRAGTKFVVKKAIKWFLKNRQKITNLVGKGLGSKRAAKFGEALKYIEGPLRKLMYAENAVMNDIRKVIFDGCRSAGMKSKTASDVAGFVMQLLELLL